MKYEIKAKLNLIKKITESVTGFKIDSKGKQTNDIVNAKRLFANIAWGKLGSGLTPSSDTISLMTLAKYMNYANHTSIINLLGNFTILVNSDSNLKQQYDFILSLLANEDNIVIKNDLNELKIKYIKEDIFNKKKELVNLIKEINKINLVNALYFYIFALLP